jgi:hypothetical protein
MCDSHRNLGGTAVAERTPPRVEVTRQAPRIVSEEDKIRGAQDQISNMMRTFGADVVNKAFKLLNQKKK